MSHLLAIAVGPVQEFIAAARRTRDLWFGSCLLSEISRAVAESIANQGGSLIFPASLEADNVANVILSELKAGNPKAVAAQAKAAAQEKWEDFAKQARQVASRVIREEIWADQVHDVIEFYAAWVPHTDPTCYPQDRARLMRLLAGRKNGRDFLPAKGRAGVPKSSLDGQRESVLTDPRKAPWPGRLRARLRVREGEQLDVVALTKRAAGGDQPYPSVARIAADSWARGNEDRLGSVLSACEQLRNQGVLHGLDRTVYPQFRAFPFEGTAVYTNRHHEWLEETEATDDQLRPLKEALAHLPEPEPYLAILVADGDRMGATISALTSADAHREFSQALARFAGEAHKIVSRHNGVLVYAGGDDVLAFLPLDRCLVCARQLHDEFGRSLTRYDSATLSVGIAIGHFMENLEDLLEYGRAAEKAAKQPDRDGLAVHLHKRGGSPVRMRARWCEGPDQRLARFADLMNEGILPTKLAYDLRAMARLYEPWGHDAGAAIQPDLVRVIARKQSRGGQTVREALAGYLDDMNAVKLLTLAEELLVARQIATALRQAGPSPARPTEASS